LRRIITVILIFCLLLVFPTATNAKPPSKTIEIDIPEYVVTRSEGWDYVDIPGGDILLIIGKPRVPYYSLKVMYPKGYRVQEVVLINKSKIVTASGLNLTIVKSTSVGTEEKKGIEDRNGWYPSKDFEWSIWVNPDGSTFLIIKIFPFHYNPETMEARFYSHYRFKIIYTFTKLSITYLSTDKIIYEPGEKVYVNILLNNSGKPIDTVIGALLKKYGSYEIVESLPLRTLHGLFGEASVTIVFNTSSLPTGDYCIEVTINDTEGHWLDKKTYSFRLGKSLINITKFVVNPQHFKIGDKIKIMVKIINAGSTTLSGTCFFKIIEEDKTVKVFRHNFSSLAPKKLLIFSSVWNTSSARKSVVYSIVAYVYYEGRTTPPLVVVASTNLFPKAIFSNTPTKIGLGEKVTFDGSASTDPDGSIVSYRWNFGDGGQASGKKVTHTYHRLGYYEVVLTVTDNEGASNKTFKIINVVMRYTLKVSSNIGYAIKGSGTYREGEKVVLYAPRSIDMSGILGILGGKYVFKKWTGSINSTKNKIDFIFKGYNPKPYVQAIYVEDYSRVILTTLIITVITTIITVILYRKRKHKK